MASLKKRGFVALDEMTHWDALALAARLQGRVYGVKVEDLLAGSMSNLELICRLKEIGFKVFADAKVHKTPSAAAAYVRRLAQCGADLITAHASGGRTMMEACVEAYAAAGIRNARKDEPGMGILAITVLSSLKHEECDFTYEDTPSRVAQRFASLIQTTGTYGLVCSPRELHALKDGRLHTGKIFTPGIRLEGSEPGRHARYDTPANALAKGADYLIIGTEVTKSPDPLAAIARIDESIAHLPD